MKKQPPRRFECATCRARVTFHEWYNCEHNPYNKKQKRATYKQIRDGDIRVCRVYFGTA